MYRNKTLAIITVQEHLNNSNNISLDNMKMFEVFKLFCISAIRPLLIPKNH